MSNTDRSTPRRVFLQSPLHALGLQGRKRPSAGRDGVVVSELAHLGYVVLRGRADDAAFMDGVAGAIGQHLPLKPKSVQSVDGGVVLWVSPDEWLLVCRRSVRDALVAALNQGLAGVFAQVVDNSGGLTTVRLAGRDHLRVLRHLGPYDFESMQPGECVGTVMSKTGVTVVRADTQGVLLVFRRSFADYTWRLLERAAQPYGLCVTEPSACADPLFAPLLQAA